MLVKITPDINTRDCCLLVTQYLLTTPETSTLWCALSCLSKKRCLYSEHLEPSAPIFSTTLSQARESFHIYKQSTSASCLEATLEEIALWRV